MLTASSSPVQAQVQGFEGVYQPLDQMAPPGLAAQWNALTGTATPPYFQPIRVELPQGGRVEVYGGRPPQPVSVAAPAQVGMAVGHTYRLRISEMPEFPGVELYPSVEVIDRLHPPPGKAGEFPVPVEFTAEEIQFALDGRLVTKVVYLEHPQLAVPVPQEDSIRMQEVSSRHNLLAEADRVGRPMLILRLGGRLPNAQGGDPAFFGTGAPVVPPPER